MFQTLSSVAEAVLDRQVERRDAYPNIRGLADDLDQHIAARATNFFELTTSAHRSRIRVLESVVRYEPLADSNHPLDSLIQILAHDTARPRA